MRYCELFEGLSSILYHSTSIKSVLEILSSNMFRLTPDFGTSRETELRSSDKIYYMSFSRSRINDYRSYSGGSCLLVLDGDKLNQRYSGKSVDYWGGSFNKDEMEDRLFSKDAYIENADNYIREIHCFPRLSYEDDKNRNLSWIRKIYIMANRMNISVYVYSDSNSYRLLDKRKSVKLSSFGNIKNDLKSYVGYGRGRRNYYAGFMELLSDIDRDKLSKVGKDLLYKISYDSYGDVKRGLSADIHNDRMGRGRENLDKFLSRLQQLGIKNIDQLLDYIKARYDL
jgi:hypothetical protein